MSLKDLYNNSKFLKADDLHGQQVRLTMSHTEEVQMQDGRRKGVLYFAGKEKGLVLNKTNYNNIAAVYGDDENEWAGHPITLFPTMVDYQGKSVEAIRVNAKPQAGARQAPRVPSGATSNDYAQAKARQSAQPAAPDDFDDTIPF